MLANPGMFYLVSGESPGPSGNAHATVVPYGTFPVADGEIALAIGNDSQFQRFCKVAGLVETGKDTGFLTIVTAWRIGTSAEQMGAALVTRTRAEWLIALEGWAYRGGQLTALAKRFQIPRYSLVVCVGKSITRFDRNCNGG
ncbi:MAG: hypothetical protein CM1200mP41_13600 [Gammaproteobacteria bacterium]|nr:MAG: hypothetical protein CM1200mP41_13600 [Gammaproteobacteria bacterium]